MHEGMLIGLVIVAVAQLPWLLWLLFREQPSGGGGGGTRRQDPPKAPLEPQFDWDSFEDNFRAYTQDRVTFGEYRPTQRDDVTTPSAADEDQLPG